MRIVFATGDAPWPPTAGGRLRDLATWRALQPLGEVQLAAFPFGVAPDESMLPRGSIVNPMPWPRARLSRGLTRLRATARRRHPFQEHLLRHGAGRQLETLLAEARPDVTVLGYPLYGEFVAVARRHSARVIVDLAELRGADVKRRLRTSDMPQVLRALGDGFVLDRVEGTAAAADEVWLVRPDDARRFADRTGAATRVVPNTVEVARYASYRRPRASTPDFSFLGAFDNGQNLAAAEWTVSAILPAVRQRHPTARLTLIGRRPPPRLQELARTNGAELRADVPDAIAALAETGPLVVPLRTGTGTKLKILEAASAGVPIVSTRRGLDGLDYRPGEEVLLAEGPAEFAAALDRLWSDPAFAQRLADAAVRRTEERYDWAVAAEAVRAGVLGTGATSAGAGTA